MARHEKQAAAYRQKAEELRVSLPEAKDRYTHDALEKIADGYDRLARVQDRLANNYKNIRKS